MMKTSRRIFIKMMGKLKESYLFLPFVLYAFRIYLCIIMFKKIEEKRFIKYKMKLRGSMFKVKL